MNCLHICNDYYGSRVHQSLYSSLGSSRDIEQYVFYPIRKNKSLTESEMESYSNSSFSLIYSDEMDYKHKLSLRFKTKFLFQSLKSKIRLSEINLIHATTLFSDGYLAYTISKEYGIPYVVTVRSTDIDVFLKIKPYHIVLLKKIIQKANAIIFVSESLREKFNKHFLVKRLKDVDKSKQKIFHNGISDFWIDHVSSINQAAPNKFLFVGRLSRRKRIHQLIKAIKLLNNEGLRCSLGIVGNGKNHVIKRIKKLELRNQDCFQFYGQVNDQEELRRIYSDYSCLVVPSKNETFGLVYLEALTQGLTVVFTKNTAIDNMFDIEHAIRSDNTTAGIKLTLGQILKRGKLSDEVALDFELFRWSRMANEHLTLYKRILKESHV